MDYWKRMTIGGKLASSYGLLVLLLVAMAITSIVRIGRINDSLTVILNERYGNVTMANDIEKGNNDQSRFLRNALLAGHDANEVKAMLEQTHKSSEFGGETMARLEKALVTDTGRALFKTMAEKRAAYALARDETIRLLKDGKVEEATRFLLDKSRPPQREYQAAIRDMIAYQDKMMHERGDAARADASAAVTTTLVMGALAVVLAVLMAVTITRALTAQLGGEPAELARVVTAVASGELGVSVTVRPGDQDSVMASVAAMREQLASVVSRVRAGSDSIATGSAQIATGNADLSQRTEEQASSLQQTAASMEELSITVKQNAQTADDANRMAEQAQAAAVSGGELVGAVVTTMQDIAQSSSKVADIIGVIDGIAFQTNILALNAAVEAARAGDQGRGFAVVASEVRSLASRAADAAREIKALITDSVSKVGIGASQVDEAGAAMQQIVAQVQGVTQLISAISSATAEQSTGIGQVVDAVAQLDQVTQQNAALVEQSAAASENLRHQAAELAQVVNVFKLGGTVGGGGAVGASRPALAMAASPAAASPGASAPGVRSPAIAVPRRVPAPVVRSGRSSAPAQPSATVSRVKAEPAQPAARSDVAPMQLKAPVTHNDDSWESF